MSELILILIICSLANGLFFIYLSNKLLNVAEAQKQQLKLLRRQHEQGLLLLKYHKDAVACHERIKDALEAAQKEFITFVDGDSA